MSSEEFDRFYADVYKRVAQEGEVEMVVVCENENFHLCGNVYVRFSSTATADKAVALLNQEWYGGRPVYCELSPVCNFGEANCRAYDNNQCTRGDHCNFMHTRRPSDDIRSRLRSSQRKSIALRKLRELMDDPKWGQEWEGATEKPYVRPGIKRGPEPEAEVEPITTTEAVERLFS